MLAGRTGFSFEDEAARRKARRAQNEGSIMNCAALLASIFPGVTLADLDKTIVYEVPKSVEASASWTKRQAAKACAYRNGIRWRIVQR
jgi:hypothetical protein